MRSSIVSVACLSTAFLLTVAAPAAGQHEHHTSPYAGTQSAEIPSLTAEEIAELKEGAGMGLARPAELNHYPGPLHVLELGESMGLSEAQRADVTAIRDRMRERAIEKGAEVLAVERHLNDAFASGTADAESIGRMTDHLGQLRGELQAIHLEAHVETRALLTPEQVKAYDRLRGYVGT